MIGFSLDNNPIVVMIDEEREIVLHMSRFEKKHEWMLWRRWEDTLENFR